MQTQPIGILGGTFDPIHLGHTHLASKMLQICHLKKILLIPCSQSPLRKQPIVSSKDRLNMVSLAIDCLDHFEVDDREIKRGGISYTIETLEALRQENPETPLAFIIAIDAFNRFDEWHEWQRILECAHLLIANRPGFGQLTNHQVLNLLHQHQTNDPLLLQKQTSGLIYLANIEPLPIMATTIRALLKEQKDASKLVAQKVWQYIGINHLYT
jgi:nicotinate-nucleotide adenylyltransferase